AERQPEYEPRQADDEDEQPQSGSLVQPNPPLIGDHQSRWAVLERCRSNDRRVSAEQRHGTARQLEGPDANSPSATVPAALIRPVRHTMHITRELAHVHLYQHEGEIVDPHRAIEQTDDHNPDPTPYRQ